MSGIDRFYCRRGDTGRPYVVFLENTVKQAQNLTDCAVHFSMKAQGLAGPMKVTDKECDVLQASTGKVSVTFDDGDVDTAGTFLAWFTVTKPDDSQIRFPAKAAPGDYNQIIILPTDA